MTYDIESDQEEELSETAPDTPLPKDLIEHLKSRKQHRKDVINTTDKLTRFFVTWSLNSTGLFIAKYLLITGGGVNLWLAITLSFSICSVGSLAGLTGLRVNYNSDGLEVDNMQNLFKTAGGLLFAGVTTWLAVKDYQYFENLTKETVSQISQDIQTIEKQNPQSDPWLSIAVALALFIGSIAIIFRGRE